MGNPTSGSDKWDEFVRVTNAGNFTAVLDPAGSGRVVVKNINKSGQGDEHATVGTGRNLPKDSVSYCAFDWLYMKKEDLIQTGRNLFWQLQMSGSPIAAISTENGKLIWVTRDNTAMKREILGDIPWGHWMCFVAGVKISDKPNGMAEIWYAVDDFPDVTKPPKFRRTGQDAYQGEVGHNTMGQYSQHSKPGIYTGYFGRFGRATTPKRAIEIAR